VRVPAAAFDRVIVDVHRGNIVVSDLTRSHAVAEGSIHLQLSTARGHIQSSG